jgi:hypothetical protein
MADSKASPKKVKAAQRRADMPRFSGARAGKATS